MSEGVEKGDDMRVARMGTIDVGDVIEYDFIACNFIKLASGLDDFQGCMSRNAVRTRYMSGPISLFESVGMHVHSISDKPNR